MHHMDGNIARPCQLHGFALGLVGNFVGEHDHPVRIADLVHEIPFIAADALKTVAAFLSRRDILGLQPVHAADQGNAHSFSPGYGLPADPRGEKNRLYPLYVTSL